MKKIFFYTFISQILLLGQSSDQNQVIKEMIKHNKISEKDVKKFESQNSNSKIDLENGIRKENQRSSHEGGPTGKDVYAVEKEDLNDDLRIDEVNTLINDKDELQIIEEDFSIESAREVAKNTNLKYFGYDIFNRDPALFQATSVGAVDPDYLIGPGDEIIVMLWGETQFRQVLGVDREGFIFIPEIGQVFVNGLNLSLLESKLFRVLSQSYASLNPQGRKATTFLDVSLGNLRPLRIQVLGEVAQPGAYTVSPSATLFSSLYYFNGPTTLGSLRDIRLIRGGNDFVSIDFYDYLLTGKKPEDQKLQLDDVIFIPKRLKTVSIEGEVNRAGVYELKPEETLKDLINMARDLKVTAYMNRAQIDRIVPYNKREEVGMDRMITDINLLEILETKNDYSLQDGDKIQIYSIMDLRPNAVNIQGSISRPGTYDLGDSLYLSELINKADSLLGDAYLERVDVIRVQPDFTEMLLKLNLEKAMQNDIENDILLKSMDRIKVYSISEMVPKTYASILGHVKKPGQYKILKNMRIYDLIFAAGGFVDPQWRSRAFLERADLIRYEENRITSNVIPFNLGNVLDNELDEQNFLLKSGDVVKIYSKNTFNSVKNITILGSVRNPGIFDFKNDMKIKDLILEAGGFKENIYKYIIEISRVDPEKLSDDLYSETIFLDMINDFSISKSENINGSGQEFKLNPYDLVIIRPDPFFRTQRTVKVLGQVYYPGVYSINSPQETVYDIVDRAGGIRPQAFPFGSVFSRGGNNIKIDLEKLLKNPKSNYNVKVNDGDVISISRAPSVIQILGEINSPGYYKFNRGTRVNDIISNAGGLSRNADKKNIYIQYANGISKKYHRWFQNHKIRDGSTVFIGREEEKEDFDSTEYFKELTSILANFAQVISILVIASGS